MKVLAIDPGNVQSAWLDYDTTTDRPTDFGICPNADLLTDIWTWRAHNADVVVVERIESYGMPVGVETFDTVRMEGRIAEACEHQGITVLGLARKRVKRHLCGDMRAKDPNVRAALLDRFGGKDAAVGRKASPGPLYGISKDVWSALALAVTFTSEEAA